MKHSTRHASTSICMFSLAAMLLFAAGSRSATAAPLVNGNFETWTSPAVPDGWTELGTTVAQNPGQSSPFTQIYPLGTNSATMTGSGNNTVGQTFTPRTALSQVTMDFKFDTLPTNGEVYHWSGDNTSNTIFRLSLGANFGKYTSNTTGIVNIMPLTAGTWYQVYVNIDVPNQVIDGGIRPFGASFYTTFTQAFSSAATSFSQIYGPASGFISGVNPNQPIVFDNIYVGDAILPVPPVPEPSTLALLGIGMVGVAVQRRRRRR